MVSIICCLDNSNLFLVHQGSDFGGGIPNVTSRKCCGEGTGGRSHRRWASKLRYPMGQADISAMATLFSSMSLRLVLDQIQIAGRRLRLGEAVLGSNRRWSGQLQGGNSSSSIQIRWKKRKESTHCPVFLLFFFFIYTMENPPWRYHGRNMREPSPWEW